MDWKKTLSDILLKKSKGYQVKEKTEEFAFVDGEMVLTKKKIVTKHIPPDISAAKALMEISEISENITALTDEQLEVEKLRLLNMLKICVDYEKDAEDIKKIKGEKL